MARETIRIDGLKELETALRNFAPMMQGKKGFPKNPLRNAARAMANEAKKSAVARAPEDTGRLRTAIAVQLLSPKFRDQIAAKGGSAELYYIGVKAGQSRDDTSGAYYANFVEAGTDKMPARPFLRPAIDARESLIGIFMAKLGRDINNIARKLNKKI